jgi:arginine/lysine/ornithine decarboxylase
LLEKYIERGDVPMHMPGHKRNPALADYLQKLGARYDITEIEGFDNLHDSCGILAASMKRAADLWKSKKSFFLVNGSTCGILAGVKAATRWGESVIVARNCHKSVYNAIEICGLNPVFIMPPVDGEFNIYASIPPKSVEEELDKNTDIRLIIITSPTYEGVISDIKAICDIAHSRNIPVLVDEAHGAHLGFSDYFGGGAVKAGADIVIQSLHKTLPSLTQTAIAHLNGSIIDENAFSFALSIFETSSPSYLLLSSADGCTGLIESKGRELFSQWERNLESFNQKAKELSMLRVLLYGEDTMNNHPLIYNFDRSKVVISTQGTSLTGSGLLKLLRDNYSIELEMASSDYALALTGLGDKSINSELLANALLDIDKCCGKGKHEKAALMTETPLSFCSVHKALSCQFEIVGLSKSSGRISADYVWAYPPGVPLIMPGEVIDRDFLDVLNSYGKSGIEL